MGMKLMEEHGSLASKGDKFNLATCLAEAMWVKGPDLLSSFSILYFASKDSIIFGVVLLCLGP